MPAERGHRSAPSNQLSTPLLEPWCIPEQNNSNLMTYSQGVAPGSERNDNPMDPCQSDIHLDYSQSRNYAPASGVVWDPDHKLAKAPILETLDDHLLLTEGDGTLSSIPRVQLEHSKVEHDEQATLRIERLVPTERPIVTTDGGNSVESQLTVLDAIEQCPADEKNNRVWTKHQIVLPNGTKRVEYRCKALDHNCKVCDRTHNTLQKARQHFVSGHVDQPCWECPIPDCPDPRKYKRLDDLKHHHIAPVHKVDYTRPRNGVTVPRKVTVTSPNPDSTYTTDHDQATPSSSSKPSNGAVGKARAARVARSAGPSQNRPRRQNSSGKSRNEGPDAAASSSHYHKPSPSPSGMHGDVLSPLGQPDQQLVWPSLTSAQASASPGGLPPPAGASPYWASMPQLPAGSSQHVQSHRAAVGSPSTDFLPEGANTALLRAQPQDGIPGSDPPMHNAPRHNSGAAFHAQWQQQQQQQQQQHAVGGWNNDGNPYKSPDVDMASALYNYPPGVGPQPKSPYTFDHASNNEYLRPSTSHNNSHSPESTPHYTGQTSFTSSPILSPAQSQFFSPGVRQPVHPQGVDMSLVFNGLGMYHEGNFTNFQPLHGIPDFFDPDTHSSLLLGPHAGTSSYSYSPTMDDPPRFDPSWR